MYKYLVVTLVISASWAEYIEPGPNYPCPKSSTAIYPCVCDQGTDIGLYISCNDTNLAALSVSLKTLANLETKVESLTISNCLIEQLFGPLFHESSIRVLTIRDTPITEIAPEAFLGVNETLQELRIINTRLNSFPREATNPLGNLILLSLDHHEIPDLPKDLFSDSALPNSVEKLYISNGNVSNIEPETFQAFKKLKVLDVHGNNLTALKKNQFKSLRNLEVLDLSYNHLKKFDASNIFDLTKLGWCNLTHNSIPEIARGTFARSSLLKWLDYSHNELKKVDSSSFRGMRFLRRLYLNDNRISDVGRGAFTAVPRIGTVDLARNELKKVDFQMFYQLNYVEEISVAENNITSIDKEAFKDLYLAKINLSHNALENIEPNAFLNCVNMTFLDLSHNKLATVQRKAFDEISYASDLLVSYNLFTDLSQVPIQNMSGLRVLNVSNNEIEIIPKNTFPKLYELHTIDLRHNRLSSIAAGAFQNLFSLRFLDMGHNSLVELNLTTFGPLTTVLEMKLNNNLLKTIHRNCFTKMSSLQSLWLENNLMEQMMYISISLNRLFFANNSLTGLQEKQWPTMNSLLYLDMSHNNLGDSLSESSFMGLLTLQQLFLADNNITIYPKDALSTLVTLRFLHLQNNQIKSLEKNGIGKMNTLYDMNLHGNQIEYMAPKVFEGLAQVVILNLSQNALQNISMDTFVNLVALQTLDLSGNQLERLDNKTNSILDPLYSLKEVNLSRNKFSTLTRQTFPSNIYIPYDLQKIDLSYNIMSYLPVDLKYGTAKLRHLNLSHNQINNLNTQVLSNLTKLEVLDLSHNDLNDEKRQLKFRVSENLTELHLEENNLQYLPIVKLGSSLKSIHLERNNIEEIDGQVLKKVLSDGLAANLQGNPLHCDCHLRGLRQFVDQFQRTPEFFKSMVCAGPSWLEGQSLASVDEALLICPGAEGETGEDGELAINPDVKYRKIFLNNGVLSVFWYVTGKRDIADFYVVIRHSETGEIVYEKTVGYNKRNVDVRQDRLKEGLSHLQLCVIAKRSNHELGLFLESQCVRISEAVRDGNRNYFYSATTTHSGSEALTTSGGFLLMLLSLAVVVFRLGLFPAAQRMDL